MDFIGAIAEDIRRTNCAVLGLDDFINGSIGLGTIEARVATRGVLNAARRLYGCNPAEDVPEPPPLFTGGQCDCARYRAAFNLIQGGTGNLIGSPGFRTRGPITNPRIDSEGALFVTTRAPLGPTNQAFPACQDAATEKRIGTANYPPGTSIASLVIIESPDGDGCGNPPPVYPPPITTIINRDITYEIDDGTEVTVNLDVEYSPIEVNFDGTLRIPFSFDLGGATFNGDVSLGANVNVRINPPRLNPGDGQGIDGEPPDQPDETVPPLPPDRKIIGVVVTATTIQQGKVSSYSSPGITEIYVPRLGSVKFVYSLGGATFFSSDIDVKDRRTFIQCPFTGGADAVIASPNVGVNFSFRAISGFPVVTTADLFING